jgi:ABC-type nitrate/sulfonate/bicarbonate transport system permease component
VAVAFWDTRDLLWMHARTTVAETALGVVLGALLGVALAVAIASSAPVRRVLEPLLVASQTVPLIVLAPLLVYWFGFGMTPKVIVVVLIVFFPVAVSTTSGLVGAEREQVDLVRSFGAGRLQVLRLVLVPTALPSFFAGLRISAAYSVAGATLGELIGGRSGLGIYIARSQRAFRYDQILAGVVIVAALSATLFGLLHLLARLTTPWQYARDEGFGRDGTFASKQGSFTVPEPTLAVPERDFAVPERDFAVPEGNLAVPEGNFAVPEGNFAVPEGNFAVPEGKEER